MAFAINEKDDFKDELIPHFIDWNRDQMDPCFAAFKRIDQIKSYYYHYYLIINLQLIGKTFIRLGSLEIIKKAFNEMKEFYKNKEVNFILESLNFCYLHEGYISDEKTKFVNKINLKMLTIYFDIWTIQIMKSLFLLNCINIDANFSVDNNTLSYIWFINTPIQLFNSKSDKMLTFEWESIKFFIAKNKFDKIKLIKGLTENYLFIPLDTIGRILYSGFWKILDADKNIMHFAGLDVEHQINTNGFILPMWYPNKTFIELSDSNLNYLNKYKDINKIFKDKHIELTIKTLGRLLEINKLLPDEFSLINFRYYDYRSTEIEPYSISEIMNSPDWINLKFIEIFKSYMLSPDEFQFWWRILRSRRTRFNLTTIFLKFKLLSECLTVLSLCSDCSELKSVELGYLEADVQDEHETVKHGKRKFTSKFGFIQKLVIWKETE